MEGGRGGAPDRRDLLKLLGGTATSYVVGGFGAEELSDFRSQVHGENAGQDQSQWRSTAPSRRLNSDSWSQQAKLAADDGDSGDWFGRSVALNGDGSTALVGAWHDDDPYGDRAGSAYLFTSNSGSWIQQIKLTAEDGDSQDEFGYSVAMADDGSTALVGAPVADNINGADAGSAYVFTNGSGSWNQRAKLVAPHGDADDQFGTSVALSGNGSTALVGARLDDDPNGEAAGSAYVFTNSGGSWGRQTKLAASDGDREDQFGWSVALTGDGSTALVGAWHDEDPNGERSGSAYVFTESAGLWNQQTKLTAADGDSEDRFGGRIALSDDGSTAIVGAPFNSESASRNRVGAAYVFGHDDGLWRQESKLTASDGDSQDYFGFPVALSDDGSIALVGAVFDEDPNGERSGSAYVFTNNGRSWNQQAKLAAADGDSGDRFAESVALSSDGATALFGARNEEDPNGAEAGSAYVFGQPTPTSGPEIQISSFTIDQTSVESGGTIELTATFSNTGDAQGTVDVGVHVGGSDGGGGRSVTVPPGGSETVQFTRTIDRSPGEYTVTLTVTDTDMDILTRDRTITVRDDPLAQIKEAHLSTAQAVEQTAVTDLFAVDYARAANEEYTEAVDRGELSEDQAFAALERLNEGIQTTETVLDHIGPEPEFTGVEKDRVNLAEEMALPTLKTAISFVMAGTAGAQKANQSGGALTTKLAESAKSKAVDAANNLSKSMIGQAASVSGRVEVESSRLVEKLLNNGFDLASEVQSAIETAAEVIAETVAFGLRKYSEQGLLALPVGLPGTTFGDSPVALDSGVDILYKLLSAESVADTDLSGTQDDAVSAAITARRDIRSQAKRSQDLIEDAGSFMEEYDIAAALFELVDTPNLRTAIRSVVSLIVTLAGGLFDAFATGAGVQGLININIKHQTGLASIVQGGSL